MCKLFIAKLIKNLDWHISKAVFFLAVLFCLCLSFCLAYEVRFEGLEDEDTLKLIESVSQLVKLKENPPSTLAGLKRRAEGDIPNIILALNSLAHYGAKVEFKVIEGGSTVLVKVDPGPVYPLASFKIRFLLNGVETHETPTVRPCLEDLKIQIGEPALPEAILNAEDLLLDKLNLQGYAFAKINKRDVFADQREKVVVVLLEVETGPLTYFGPIKIKGLERVKQCFFFRKLRWQEGDVYDPKKLEKTQEALELSGLFRSVNIQHAEHLQESDQLPIEINVVEAKQRSVGFGLNYTTQLGPGITGEWEDRNFAGEGQRLTFRTDIWRKLQEGRLTYLVPDFKRQNQNLILQIDYNHEKTKAFTESALSLSATIERKLSENLRISYGAMYKNLHSERSDRNGTFDLFKIPLQLQWTNVDSILDPTQGAMVQFRMVPSLQILPPSFAYSINSLTTSFYQPLTADKRHIFAAKLMLGSIVGASKHDIPPPERFYAGSENALRGYRYLTVSPIGRDHKPLGGRSLFVYSLELRNRIGKNFGLVFFYEIGNVYLNYYPEFSKGMLQSAGLGLRYHTPVGPLRLDFAVPLDRRKHIDNAFEVYFSIGQSF